MKLGATKGKFIKGHIPWNKGKRGYFSKEALAKMSRKGAKISLETRKKQSESIKKAVPRGDKHYSWNPESPKHCRTLARKIMKKHLGTNLKPQYIVHHFDKNIKNNTVDNLCVMSRASHIKLHRLLGDIK